MVKLISRSQLLTLNNFIFVARTPIAFLSSYMIVGTVFPDDKCYIIDTLGEKEANKAVESNFRAAAHQCILDLDFKQHNASAIACAIVYFVRQELEFTPVWREELTELTNYDPYVNVNVAELIIMIQKKLRPNRYAVGAFDASNAELLGCRLNSTSSIDEAVFKVESSPLSIADFDKL